MRRSWRGAGWWSAAAVPLAGLGVLAAQVSLARSREYLPREPGHALDGLRVGDAAGEPVRVAVLGDSTVAGVGSPDTRSSLPALIADRLAEELARPVVVHGLGASGAVTRDVVDRQVAPAAARRPEVVVAVVGSNDVTHLTSPRRLRRDTAALATAVREQVHAPLVLAGVPRFDGADALARPLRDVVVAYARVLRDVQREAAAAHGAALVEIARDASPRFAGVPEAMSGDGFHPAPVGYGFWADAIAPVTAGALRRS